MVHAGVNKASLLVSSHPQLYSKIGQLLHAPLLIAVLS